jgi:alpha-D-xyloside xylohydrolase
VIKTSWPATQWSTESTAQDTTLTTARLKLSISRKDGAISYFDAGGKRLIQESAKIMTPTTANGEPTYRAEAVFPIYGSMEALYGLGQHQAGVWNYRGASVELSQENTEIAIPLLLSSNGYGIYWNNDSRSRVNNRFVHTLYISSEVADTIDYYFIYGPDFDKIVAAYRELTGAVPMFGKWAYGFWQCKNKYQSQEELLGVARKYRDLHIPVDNIVQDWFWWNHKGEHVFNSKYPDPKGMIDELHREHYHLMISVWPFFDPGTAVYADMDKRGYLIDRTKVAGFHPQGMAIYDATNPAARAYYWHLMDGPLFQRGADAWWLDTDEPETEGREENILLDHKLSIGSGARYANLYPLMHTEAVHDGQRAESDQKRVFILSRSAFAGVQRYGVTAWSGDILSNFESFKRQIPAGLNFAVSGLPYWTTDIGGFFIGNPDDPKFRELFVRWFEYGAFCPIFRVHGTRTTDQNELWSYGPQAQSILVSYDKLRYELMPYIYSLAWKTTHDSYTPMRPLVMDFRDDRTAQNIGDQFLYGPAILVNPVTEAGATTRHLYLPKTGWIDFWTGKAADGGHWIEAPAGLDRIPLYARAGSIVPMGPDVEYTTEKAADPIELRVYPGADGDFVLYEDENDNYDYEKGSHTVIPIHWDDAAGKLTIGERLGNFPGMLQNRTFQVVFVREGHGVGIGATANPDLVVMYSGVAMPVTRQQ